MINYIYIYIYIIYNLTKRLSPSLTTGGYLPTSPGRSIDELLSQLRKEPANEEECAAKFMLYEGYAREVEEASTKKEWAEQSTPTDFTMFEHDTCGMLELVWCTSST